jgi:hypothetical protein
MFAFDDAELVTLGKAFDRAWDRFLRTGMLSPFNLIESQEILASRILHSARLGERDEWRLAREALFYLWQTIYPGAAVPIAPQRAHKKRKGLSGQG